MHEMDASKRLEAVHEAQNVYARELPAISLYYQHGITPTIRMLALGGSTRPGESPKGSRSRRTNLP
ncbi:MAG: hypothetical protein SRB1_01194 [Desulfobacteraceae bacterium Eth-SRB1]|nr:MAG: hypothetical protein SRB1_01194 [Desulfobacteraceae bacterium Eth-SRB1]